MSLLSAASIHPQRASAAANHGPVGVLEIASFSNGQVSLAGWALDPDTASSIRVQVKIDNRAARQLAATGVRPDLVRRYPRNGKAHGFVTAFSLGNGHHTICVVGLNRGAGSNRTIGCRAIVVNNNPVGRLDTMYQVPQGVLVSGWLVDPNSRTPVTGVLALDGRPLLRLSANQSRPTTYATHYGLAHGFRVMTAVAPGPHRICLTGLNIGPGVSQLLDCKSITVTHDPVGAFSSATRVAGSQVATVVTGYALDLDDVGAIQVRAAVDGVAQPAQAATTVSAAATAAYPNFSQAHGFALTVNVPDANQHQICLTALNVGVGADHLLGCRSVASTGDLTPGQPVGVTGWPGSGRTDISWSPSRAVSSPVTSYTIAGLPLGRVLTVDPSVTRATITGLVNGSRYTFTVTAHNDLGAGSGAVVTVVPSYVPPQFTPAPVSTSHYPRNLRGNLAVDTAMARAQGARDAAANPSNHRYTILQDIGGQDESRGGVLLSATSIFQSYAHVLAVMQAYTDGYASKQRPFAPLLLAIGTNNDVDVSATSGMSWARKIINPLSSYVSAHHPGIEVAGANDIEPGFSAGVAPSRGWVSGYLSATGAKYVFNGSADGCSTIAAGRGCNNRWSMADLQWLAGGAAPSRTIALPQIYNSAMALQWKFISLTGVNARLPKLYFGGPLTEYTACGGGSRCYSIPGHEAWTLLWSAISSLPATRQYELPYSTDLMIN